MMLSGHFEDETMEETTGGEQPGPGEIPAAGESPAPPPPTIIPSVLPVYTHSGQRYRLGYVSGGGSGSYEVWDTEAGVSERFPPTDEGWERAWRLFSEREAASREAPALEAYALAEGGPERSTPRRRRRRTLSAAGSSVAAVVIVLIALSQFLGGNTIFEDDFSDEESWAVEEDADGAVDYAEGAYRISVQKAEFELLSHVLWEDEALAAVGLEVDVMVAGGDGAASVICVSTYDESSRAISSRDRYYDFYIVPSTGSYGIAATHSPDEPLVTGRRGGVISATGSNRIRAECRGRGEGRPTTLVLHVNGERLLEYSDPSGYALFRGMGLSVYSFEGGTEGMFDNALATRL